MTFTKNIKIAQTRQRFQGTCYNISKSKQFVTHNTREMCGKIIVFQSVLKLKFSNRLL